MHQSELDFIRHLRQSSPYIAAHRGKTIVIYLPSEILALDEHLLAFAKDMVLLNNLGLKIVLALGASQQIDDALRDAGFSWETHNNCRITEAAHVKVLQQTIGVVRSKLEAAFTQACAEQHSSLPIVSGNWVIAKPKGVLDGIDFQHTGSLRRVDERGLNSALDSQQITLLTPLAYSLSGEVFNLNTLEQAFAVSKAICADKLMIFTEDAWLEHLPKSLSQADLTKTAANADTDVKELLENARQASPEVKRIHLISRQNPGALLLELFSREGIGTLIYNDKYHQIRPAKIDDVAGIIHVITPLEEQGILVKRSRETLEQEIEHFIVAEVDQQIIGCAALYPLENHTAELACLAVDDQYRKSALGRDLLAHIQTQAKPLGINKLVLLTTHAHHWFQEQGFQQTGVDALPPKRQLLYNWQRHSKVLTKTI